MIQVLADSERITLLIGQQMHEIVRLGAVLVVGHITNFDFGNGLMNVRN